jgi:tetratricopeptide (TPR) repeat protein
MATQTLFILGDSTSMTIGCERETYPYIMADQTCWSEGTEIINCSLPGITSADACAFFFRENRKFPLLKAVVLHLGTCDATSWEINRGRYNKLREIFIRYKEARGAPFERARLKNKLLYFDWNNDFSFSTETPEKPKDYEYNLSRIIKNCIKKSLRIIIVRPKANASFPSGAGKGNFIFYRYLGLNDSISNQLNISDNRFIKALELHELKNYSGAKKKYREVLRNSGPLSSNNEFLQIVTNNYAVCAAEAGDFQEAEHLLLLLLKEKEVRSEIILFNLAKLYRMLGNENKYVKYLHASREADVSMYRIRSPYLDVIDRVSSQYKEKLDVIDVGAFVNDDMFVDHTHPLYEGQEKIANRIIECLREPELLGSKPATIQNKLFNPELALGNTTRFFSYYKTQGPFTEHQISAFRSSLKASLNKDNSQNSRFDLLKILPREIKTAIEYHLKHPCFPSIRFLLDFGPQYPIDVGRFPEMFLARQIVPYLQYFENEPAINNLFSNDIGIIPNSDKIKSILPGFASELIPKEIQTFSRTIEMDRLSAIIVECKRQLQSHLQQGNQIHNRLKTTIYWYFRETLRYGAHSRFSMRYDRITLEYIAEALVVALILNQKVKGEKVNEILSIIDTLNKTVMVHEYFCQQFSLNSNSKELLEDYELQLLNLFEI